MHRLTPSTYTGLRELADDKSVPPLVRAELADWLGRYDAAQGLLMELREACRNAQADLAQELIDTPRRVAGALASPPVPAALLMGRTVELAERHDVLSKQYDVVTGACSYIAARLSRECLIGNLEALVPWLAAQVVTAAGRPLGEGASLTAQTLLARLFVRFPFEAVGDGDGLVVPMVQPLVVSTSERSRWAWSCIAAGLYEKQVKPDRVVWVLTADWDDRETLLATGAPTEQPPAKRGRSPIGTGR